MKVFLIVVFGSLLIATTAHSHGNHSHGGVPQTIPRGNGNGSIINLYREESCSCCSKWGARMVKRGFQVVDHVSEPDAMSSLKSTEGIPAALASCHTAFVDGYFIEGHVPAESINRLLRDLPDIAGLTVPGMPQGSPGMETPMAKGDVYDVLAVAMDGSTTVYDSYQGLNRRSTTGTTTPNSTGTGLD